MLFFNHVQYVNAVTYSVEDYHTSVTISYLWYCMHNGHAERYGMYRIQQMIKSTDIDIVFILSFFFWGLAICRTLPCSSDCLSFRASVIPLYSVDLLRYTVCTRTWQP